MIPTTNNVIGLEKPTFEVADILLSHILDYQKVQWLKPEQYKIVYDLLNCRTSYLGGHIEHCDHCRAERVSYNSCRTRSAAGGSQVPKHAQATLA